MSRIARFLNVFFGAVALCLVASLIAGGYLFFKQKRGLDEAQARDSLQRARKVIGDLGKRPLSPPQASELEEARKDVELAEGLLRKGAYQPCIEQLDGAMSRLKPIQGEVETPREGGKVVAVSGACRVRRPGGQEESLQAGGVVRAGDSVQTAGDASALLSFPNGESLVLLPGAAFDLAALPGQARASAVKVSLQRGSLVYRSPRVVREEYAGRVESGGGSVQPEPGAAFQVSASSADGFDVQVFEGEAHVSCGPASADLRGGLAARAVSVRKAGIQEGAVLLAPPQAVAPAERQIFKVPAASAKGVRLEWEPSRAASVRVQVADNPLFASGLLLDRTATGQSSDSGPLKEGTYFWRLRSAGNDERTFWSGPISFSVVGIEGAQKTPPDWILEVEATPVGDSVLLKGSVKPKARVTVNDVEVTVDEDGTFLGTFLLPARGPRGRPVTVCAFDAKGNEKVWTRNF